MVTMTPPGSLPGMISFASAPTTNPTMSVQMIDMATPPSSNLMSDGVEASVEARPASSDRQPVLQKVS
jgi:hypothetical protein